MPPFFSVVIPTRSRPERLRQALLSLARQTFPDFEAVVSDDPAGEPARDLVQGMGDARFRYRASERPLPMHENWEAGLSAARGRYRLLLTDKAVLRPSALRLLHDAAVASGAEIVSSAIEAVCSDRGYVPMQPASTGVRPFDPRAELRRKLQFAVPHSADTRNFFLGNPCCGVYREDLVARILARLGRVFSPACPDYTAMAAALALANSAVDLGEPIAVCDLPTDSVGYRMATQPAFARESLLALQSEEGRDFLAELPIAGVYASLANVIAGDYRSVLDRLAPDGSWPRPDHANLVRRVEEDLAAATWESVADWDDQVRKWRACAGELVDANLPPASRQPRIRVGWRRLCALLHRVVHPERQPPTRSFADILAVAEAADAHYARAGDAARPTIAEPGHESIPMETTP